MKVDLFVLLARLGIAFDRVIEWAAYATNRRGKTVGGVRSLENGVLGDVGVVAQPFKLTRQAICCLGGLVGSLGQF